MKKYPLKAPNPVAVALGISLLTLAACDTSKEELAVARAERDELKSQLGNLQAAVHAAQKDFEAAKEQAAKCQPAAAASAPQTAAVAADAGGPTPAGGIAKKLTAKK